MSDEVVAFRRSRESSFGVGSEIVVDDGLAQIRTSRFPCDSTAILRPRIRWFDFRRRLLLGV